MTTATVFLLPGTTSWTDPGDVGGGTIQAYCIGPGGKGSAGGAISGGAGGGAGEYRTSSGLSVTFPVTVSIPTGNSASDTSFNSDAVRAVHGANAINNAGGLGGTGGVGTTGYNGGDGGGNAV